MDLKEKLKTITDEEHFSLLGILASIVLMIALFIPQIGYSGREGESYSILNHFVSELGEIGVSYLWIIFSIGLIVGGFLFIPFMIGLGLYIKGFIAKIAMVLGALSAIACIMVGFFPMNFLYRHYLFAMLFFMGAMITILIFTIAIVLKKDSEISKLFVIPSIAVFIIYLMMFTVIDFSEIGNYIDLESGTSLITNRPDVWIMSIMEWLAVLSVLGYLFSISLYIYFNSKK